MKRFTKIFVILGILAALIGVTTPNLLSSSYVKQRLEAQLSDLTGRAVTLRGNSSVSMRPYLAVSYSDVIIGKTTSDGGESLVVVEGLQAKLGLFAALWGDAQLAEVRLVRPRFNLRIDQQGVANWTLRQGKLAELFNLKQDEKPGSFKLGTVVLEDGIIDFNDDVNRVTHRITSLNGRISWENINGGGEADLLGVWRGEVFSLKAEASSPYDLLRKANSSLKLELSSKPLTLAFDGTVMENVGKGDLTASVPSMSRFEQWMEFSRPFASKWGAATIAGDAVIDSQGVKFEQASVTMGDARATGRLQVKRHNSAVAAISGTLAFESLTLPRLAELSRNRGTENPDFDFAFLNGLQVDVRLSSKQARLADVQLEDLAASLLIKNGRGIFDIGQSNALGGSLTGSFSLASGADTSSLESDLTLTKVDLGQLSQLFSGSSISLDGSGTAKVKLKATGKTPQQMLLRLNGEGSIRGAQGTLRGVNLDDLMSAQMTNSSETVGQFPGETAYSNLAVNYFIANGIAVFRDTALKAPNMTVTVNGRSDLTRRSLALRGRISRPRSASADEEARKEPLSDTLSFFVGGVADAPLFVGTPKDSSQRVPPTGVPKQTQSPSQ